MESGDINDSQINASSFHIGLNPWKGRLNNDHYWATSVNNPPHPWIQVDLLRSTVVTGIITQGGSSLDWVESLQIQFGDSEDTLMYILEDGKAKVSISHFPHMGLILEFHITKPSTYKNMDDVRI